jgi:mRNA interferase MazF
LPTTENGIKKNSLIRLSKIATIDKKLALGKIGRINEETIFELNAKLKSLFQL